MKQKIQNTIVFSIILVVATSVFGQRKMTRTEYVELYKDIAIEKMHIYGIPASITLAQGILESGCGSSDLAIKAKNHFGIKCHKEWTGKTFTMDDDEKNECFRKYDDPADSYRDHSLFLTTRERYADLFKLKSTDYEGWALGLKKAGYATNPQYPQLLIKIIEEEGLHKYDLLTPEKFAEEKKKNNQTDQPETAITTPSSKLPDINSYMKHEKHEIASNGRQIYINNGVKYVLADVGETLYSIADEFEIYPYQLFNYNELTKNDNIKIGEVVYLEPKKKRGEQTTYTVLEGQNLRDVSQRTGIKLKSLCKWNDLTPNESILEGTVLKLRK